MFTRFYRNSFTFTILLFLLTSTLTPATAQRCFIGYGDTIFIQYNNEECSFRGTAGDVVRLFDGTYNRFVTLTTPNGDTVTENILDQYILPVSGIYTFSIPYNTPDDVTLELLPPSSPALEQLEAGYSLHLAGDYEGAIALYTEGIERDNEYAELYDFRAYSYRAIGEYQLGIDDNTLALTYAPNSAITYIERGILNHIAGFDDAALEDLDRAVEIPLPSDEAYFWRGIIQLSLGDIASAEADILASGEFYPRFSVSVNFWLWVIARLEKDGSDMAAYMTLQDSLQEVDEGAAARSWSAHADVVEGDIVNAFATYETLAAEIPYRHWWINSTVYLNLLERLFPDRDDIAQANETLREMLGMETFDRITQPVILQ